MMIRIIHSGLLLLLFIQDSRIPGFVPSAGPEGREGEMEGRPTIRDGDGLTIRLGGRRREAGEAAW